MVFFTVCGLYLLSTFCASYIFGYVFRIKPFGIKTKILCGIDIFLIPFFWPIAILFFIMKYVSKGIGNFFLFYEFLYDKAADRHNY